MIGEAYQGHLNFDDFSANCSFAWNFDIQAQYCWARRAGSKSIIRLTPDVIATPVMPIPDDRIPPPPDEIKIMIKIRIKNGRWP